MLLLKVITPFKGKAEWKTGKGRRSFRYFRTKTLSNLPDFSLGTFKENGDYPRRNIKTFA
jgi:hypothetical protein